MDFRFERSPQDDDSPFGGGGDGGETGVLASLFNAAMSSQQQQRTQYPSATVVTDLFGNVVTTNLPLTGPATETLDDNTQESTETINYFTVTNSASSLPPTTFATTTSDTQQHASSQIAGQTAHADQNQTAGPTSYAQTDRDGGLSNGEIAAATIVPIVAALLIAMAFLILRRRNKAKRTAPPNGSIGKSSFFGAGLKEKWGSLRSSASSQKDPVVTSHSNNAYMTGLDTSSRSGDGSQQNSGEYYAAGRRSDGGTTFMDAPPPYIVHPHSNGAPVIPVLSRNLSDMSSSGHEMSQLSPAHQQLQAFQPSPLLTPTSLDPPQSSGRSARSINSDAYSDTASIHSARAARMSIGGPAMINRTTASGSRMSSLRGDPFDDPSTPVPSLPAESRRASDGSEQSTR